MRQGKTSGLATTSLVLGILGLTCCGLFTGIAAIICGHMARGRIKRASGELKGEGLALAGLILGYLSILTTLVQLAFLIPAQSEAVERARMVQVQKLADARQIQLALRAMAMDGAVASDKSLGYPADAGITSVSELKARLVENHYLSAEDAEGLPFEDFLIGNVSASDPPNTIIVKSRPQIYGGTMSVFTKGGDGNPSEVSDPNEGVDPPRDPPYLAP